MKQSEETKILAEIDIEQLWRHVETVSQGVRLSGSAEERQAFDYLADMLRGYGAEVKTYQFESLVGYPGPASFEVVSPEVRSFRCITHAFSPPTPEGGSEGELVYVARGNPVAYQGIDVSGKIVILDGYGLALPAKAHTAEVNGAMGQVFIHDQRLHEMIVSTVWGTPTPETAAFLPRTPAVSITGEDGAYLKELLKRGPVRGRIRAQGWTGWKQLPVLVAELRGETEPEKFVLFSGHVDSWYYGAMDNASANATSLEVARVLSRHRSWLRRSLRLAFWSGHSHGRYSGSAWYADNFWEDLHRNCVAHVNIDSTGARGATDLSKALCMAELRDLAAGVIRELTGQELQARRPGRAGDQSFWGCGVPSVFMSLSEQPGGGLGWWWHTPEDTLDKLDRENLLRDAKVYALTLLRLCSWPVLPLDYVPVAEEFLNTLTQLQQVAGDTFSLEPCIKRAEEFKTEVTAFREAIKPLLTGRLQKVSRSVRTANDTLMELGRLLIPAYYSQVGPFDHDIAAPLPPLPGLQPVTELASLDPGSNEFRFLRTRLVRESNKLCHALSEAASLTNAAYQWLRADRLVR